ncbi:MAG TPA: hypothetical protein VIC32_00395 [Terriglobales bacterium]|jgi:predicted N-acetyltransferase YhbS
MAFIRIENAPGAEERRAVWTVNQAALRGPTMGLAMLRERDEKIVIVAGHPDYYPKFGFSTEQAAGLESPFPREAFMAIELCRGALDGIRGVVVYAPPFGIKTDGSSA